MQNQNEGIYRDLKLVDLKQILKQRGISAAGLTRKANIISKLEEDDARQPASVESDGLTYRGTISTTTSDDVPSTNSIDSLNTAAQSNEQKMLDRKEREGIVLWRRPFTTFSYFLLQCVGLFRNYGIRLLKNWRIMLAIMVLIICMLSAYYIEGSHQSSVRYLEKEFLWCSYWVGLGILSSVGLGTGLHTFLLYLGPHIAAVTLAAFECMSVNFPEPPYPNSIICPDVKEDSMTLWTIMSKVRLEAMMWGAGTAIGELPPYFMARAARLSGEEFDADDEFEELEELLEEQRIHPQDMGFMERAKLGVHRLVQRVGFVGILLCASIPNPLFDLAGITCGHFLIPFWTFFGATLIGKAIIKMHIQKLFVIFAFSKQHVEHLINLIKYIPAFGESLQAPFKEYLDKQKQKLHHKPGTAVASETSWLSWLFEKVVLLMVVYFVISIIHSMAQSYHKKICRERNAKKVNKE